MSHCHMPAGSELRSLRGLLARLEVPDCDCESLLSCPCGQECTGEAAKSCRHCREECDCPPLDHQPPCCHVLAPVDPADLLELANEYRRHFPGEPCHDPDLMRARLLRLASPGEYGEPPLGLPCPDAVTREDRVNAMALRASLGLAVRHPLDRWRRPTSSLAVQAARLRNGAIAEREVRRA